MKKSANRVVFIWMVLEIRISAELSFWSIIRLESLLRIIFRSAKLAVCPTLSTCESEKHIGLLWSVFTEAYALLGVDNPRRYVKPVWAHVFSNGASWNRIHWISNKYNLFLHFYCFSSLLLVPWWNKEKWIYIWMKIQVCNTIWTIYVCLPSLW